MKVLYLYSDKTGIKKSRKKINKLHDSLRNIYKEIDIVKTTCLDDFKNRVLASSKVYDILLVAGGDGTLKLTVDLLMSLKKEDRPVLGYIPTGTVNDAGKAIGAGKITKALKVLKENNIEEVDVCKVNDQHFNFVCAAGAYSDISYATKRGPKKILGRLAYYFYAISEVFRKTRIEAEIEINGEKKQFVTPFIMVLNSRNVGGFAVNFHYSVKDGLVEVFITKQGLFNGLLHYLFFEAGVTRYKTDHLKITLKTDDYWCFDGEKGDKKTVDIKVLKQELKVIGKVKK